MPRTAVEAAVEALRAGLCLVHAQSPAVDKGAVDASNGAVRGFIAFHLHEGEAFALPDGTVDDDGHFAHVTVGGEDLWELLVGGGVRQVADIDAGRQAGLFP